MLPSLLLRIMISKANSDTLEIHVTRTKLLSMYLLPQCIKNYVFPFLLYMLSAIAMVWYSHWKLCSWRLGYCCLMPFFINCNLKYYLFLSYLMRCRVILFRSIFFSWLLTGLSNLPWEVSASAKFSPHWQYLHYPLSTLEPWLPFLPHCLERH